MKTKTNTLIEDGQDVVAKEVTASSKVSVGETIQLIGGTYPKIKATTNQYFDVVLATEYEQGFRIYPTRIFVHLPLNIKGYSTSLLPEGLTAGALVYDTSTKRLKVFDGTKYIECLGGSLDDELNLSGFPSVEISTDEYGGFYVNDEGFVFSTQGVNLSQAQLQLAGFSTASRPIPQGEGAVIYDSTLKKCIMYNGLSWVNLDGTAL